MLSKDITTLNEHGGFLWLLFSTNMNESLSMIEKMVDKVKKIYEKIRFIKTL